MNIEGGKNNPVMVPGAACLTSVAGSQYKTGRSETAIGTFTRADWYLRGLWQHSKGAGTCQVIRGSNMGGSFNSVRSVTGNSLGRRSYQVT